MKETVITNKRTGILKPIQFMALFFLLLVVGVFWGPWLGLHRSIDLLTNVELIHVVKIMAHNLGAPMQILLPVCILLMLASGLLYPQKKSKEFYFIIVSIILIIISLLISVGIELPIVNQIKEWTEYTVPANWEGLRDHWVFYHVIRMVIALVSFGLFSAAILQPFDFKRPST